MAASLYRRLFLRLIGASGAAGAAASCADDGPSAQDSDVTQGSYEYIVVGSGAGGGPLACNLARQGHRVLLLEAGDDRGDLLNYQVPAWHTFSTEDERMRWDYFVQHYDDSTQAARDSKMVYAADGSPKGVLYPRAGTLGGCTAHNAMITVYPHESDWDTIASITGDASWSSANMRRYFEILERCHYSSCQKQPGHGEGGWLDTELPDSSLALSDIKLLKVVQAAAFTLQESLSAGPLSGLWAAVKTPGELIKLLRRDLNTAAPERDQTEGLFTIPTHTKDGRRDGPRELIIETVQAGYPLTVKTHALVSRVLFAEERDEEGKLVATGVEFLEGESLYRADPRADAAGPGTPHTATATREVILSAGAFNTPQLLKLSGIGPRGELEALGIEVAVELPGVGTNLQDRYEVGLVSQMSSPNRLITDCTFGAAADPCLAEWEDGKGAYTSNGGVVGIVKKSSPSQPVPDLFVFGLPGNFRGYEPGYSTRVIGDKTGFTWAVLKAHTGNTAGTVTLRSTDPRDTPDIRFRYFHEGTTDTAEDVADMDAMVAGVELARQIGDKTDDLMIFGSFRESYPGRDVSSREQVEDFVRNEAWGHHASCTCPIGADDDPFAVLDARFRVRGTRGLRVVDASVFPKIPGFFIVVPIYMISEKATDVLLEDIGETRSA
jgi:choline dehydrogenase